MDTKANTTHQQLKESHRSYYVSILLPNSSDRRVMVEQFLRQFETIPLPVEILASKQLMEQELDAYQLGKPRGEGIYRGMGLDLWVEICGKKPAKLYIEEITDEVVMLNFEFKASEGKPPLWDSDKGEFIQGNTHHFWGFLMALNKFYPVLIGTIGLDLTASDILCLDGGESFSLASKLTLEQLARPLLDPYSEYNYDFAIINPIASGAHAPFMYSLFRYPPEIDLYCAAVEHNYYDLELVEEIQLNAGKAERFYTKMYDSKYPKDDRDDAMLFLSKAIDQAIDLGLEQVAASLKKRFEHINAVFNSQFRYV